MEISPTFIKQEVTLFNWNELKIPTIANIKNGVINACKGKPLVGMFNPVINNTTMTTRIHSGNFCFPSNQVGNTPSWFHFAHMKPTTTFGITVE
jgi:hypothetical protein